MPLALVTAALACDRARFQQRLHDLGVVLGQATCDRDGGGTDVGALHAQPYALDHLGHVLLAQVRVDVGGAGFGAGVEGVGGGGPRGPLDVERRGGGGHGAVGVVTCAPL